ncbi:MAG: cation diffusion facilitator family transporter [Lachnospiraceae bacterium]|nr:cation diffusion facilitator family transporter [Lachnospiraceae bacterium]
MNHNESEQSRDKIIVKTSVIGILTNAGLAAFKALIGLITHSIAITMDAVNNLSDAGSSLITIVGTKLAAKEADRKHPFGYGRIEYLSAMVISLIVLYAGLTSLEESVKSILHPKTPSYTAISLVIVAAAVFVKIILGSFVKKTGEKVHSESLVNSGKDALLDSVISASTLIAALVYILTKVSLEAWLGALISLVIIKSGIDMLRETLSQILGENADLTLIHKIKNDVKSFPEVQGVYDLVLNNYGPDTFNGSLHIEVADTMDANELDELIRQIQYKVLAEDHVILTAVSVYAMNTHENRAAEVERSVRTALKDMPGVKQMHGFYLNEEKKTIRFDLVISFSVDDRKEAFNNCIQKIQAMYPDYSIQAAMDKDLDECLELRAVTGAFYEHSSALRTCNLRPMTRKWTLKPLYFMP